MTDTKVSDRRVQEIMLAKKLTILCGTKQVSWAKLENLFIDLRDIYKRGREYHTTFVHEVLDSPARTIVTTKSIWHCPLPFTYLLLLLGNQDSTKIIDKVYGLHGLASDSASIRIDYTISPKALLVELIYHACTASTDRPRLRNSKMDALRVARKMKEILKVHCSEDELNFHTSVARGEGIEKSTGLRYTVAELPRITVNLENIAGYQQPFPCLNKRCPKIFPNLEARLEHMQIHMEEAKHMLGPNLENLETDWETEDED
jgi:hypothetical protein